MYTLLGAGVWRRGAWRRGAWRRGVWRREVWPRGVWRRRGLARSCESHWPPAIRVVALTAPPGRHTVGSLLGNFINKLFPGFRRGGPGGRDPHATTTYGTGAAGRAHAGPGGRRGLSARRRGSGPARAVRRAVPADHQRGRGRYGRRPQRQRRQVLHAGLPDPAVRLHPGMGRQRRRGRGVHLAGELTQSGGRHRHHLVRRGEWRRARPDLHLGAVTDRRLRQRGEHLRGGPAGLRHRGRHAQ